MTKQQSAALSKVTGKNFEELSESELASLQAEIEAKRKAMREALEKTQFELITKAADDMAVTLTWGTLPRILLAPDASGKKYEFSLIPESADKKTRTKTTDGGDITVNKLGLAHNGIAQFKDQAGNSYEKIQDLVKALKQPDGKPESDRCWDIQHKLGNNKGISASDIVLKHAGEVTLVYKDGKTQLLNEAVEEANKARASA